MAGGEERSGAELCQSESLEFHKMRQLSEEAVWGSGVGKRSGEAEKPAARSNNSA